MTSNNSSNRGYAIFIPSIVLKVLHLRGSMINKSWKEDY